MNNQLRSTSSQLLILPNGTKGNYHQGNSNNMKVRTLPPNTRFLCFKQHSKAHSDRDTSMINSFNVLGQGNDKFWRASPERKVAWINVKWQTQIYANNKQKKDHTLGYKKWWNDYSLQLREQQQQEGPSACYHLIKLMKASQFVAYSLVECQGVTDSFHSWLKRLQSSKNVMEKRRKKKIELKRILLVWLMQAQTLLHSNYEQGAY